MYKLCQHSCEIIAKRNLKQCMLAHTKQGVYSPITVAPAQF